MNTLLERYKVRLEFTEPLLGSQPQRDVATEYLHGEAVKAGKDVADEIESLPEELAKGTTAFHRNPETGECCLWDYQIKGFFKEWSLALNGDQAIGGLKNARSKMDTFAYVLPRRIKLNYTGDVDHLPRPLKAMTAQGPRVTVARSEMLPVGTWIEFEIHCLKGIIPESMIREILELGAYKGLGQWRNGSYGRFSFTLTAA